MSPLVYIVQAYRWGDRDLHSYIVGVFKTETAALDAANIEEAYRGGKYTCEVVEWPVDSSIAGVSYTDRRVLRPLPPITKEHFEKKRQMTRSTV